MFSAGVSVGLDQVDTDHQVNNFELVASSPHLPHTLFRSHWFLLANLLACLSVCLWCVFVFVGVCVCVCRCVCVCVCFSFVNTV